MQIGDTKYTDHRQTWRAAAGSLIRLRLSHHKTVCSCRCRNAVQLTSNLKHMHLRFSHSRFIVSSICLSACPPITHFRLSHENAGIVQRTWQHAKEEREQEGIQESERRIKSEHAWSREGGRTYGLYAERPPPLLLAGGAARPLVAPSLLPPPTVPSSSSSPASHERREESLTVVCYFYVPSSRPVCCCVKAPGLHTQTSSHAWYILRAFKVATHFT